MSNSVLACIVAAVVAAIMSALVTAGILYWALEPSGASIEPGKGDQIVHKQQQAITNTETPAKVDATSIEFVELLKLYMLPADSDLPPGASTFGDWFAGSSPGTPISWEHEGIKDCDEYQKKEFGTYFCRTGSVVVTVRGSPTHRVLGKTVEPGRWQVTMMGPRGGFTFVSIDSNVISHEFPGTLERASEGHDDLKITSLRSCDGSYTSGNELFRVTLPGKQPVFVQKGWSCGATGLCSESFVLSWDQQDAEKLMLKTCAPLSPPG
jgi:hypothetical protein